MRKPDSRIVRRIAWFLTFAGAVPLAGLTATLFIGETAQVRVPTIAALVTYCAVVLSFLGGIGWGLALREEVGTEKTRALTLGFSSVPALAAWAVLWLPSPTWQLSTALAIFTVTWALDQWLSSQGLLPTWFVDLRSAITGVSVVILGLAIWKL